MKRGFFLTGLLSWIPGFCLMMGAPTEPNVVAQGAIQSPDSLFSVKIAYEGEFVFDNRLTAFHGAKGRLDQFAYQINQAVVSFGLFDRVEVYGSTGAFAADFSYLIPDVQKQLKVSSHDQMTWGMGGRALLWEWGNIGLGMQGSYQWAGSHLKSTTLEGAFVPTKRAMLSYYQWQIGFSTSYQSGIFVPYIGAKFMNTRVHLYRLNPALELGSSSLDMRNRVWIGVALGCALVSPKAVDLTVEIELFDQSALSICGNIKF